MAIQTSGTVAKGALPGYGAGASPVISQDQFGANLVTELNARYANLVLSGSVFGVSYTAAALIVPSATATGAFALFNPANSGKNLVILAGLSGLTAQTTPGTTGFAIGYQFVPNQTPTTVTPGNTPQNALIGNG